MKAVREEEAIGGRPNTDALAIVVKARSAAAALESSCLKSDTAWRCQVESCLWIRVPDVPELSK